MELNKCISSQQLKEYEEMIKIETLTNDKRVYAVCKVLKMNSQSFEDYIYYLKDMSRLLASGITVDTIIDFMMKNKYKECDKLPMKTCELTLEEMENVTIKLPNFDEEQIKDVIFNDPATIVFWKDGTKTVVKCQKNKGDTYNPELGLAMCIIKKMCGNRGNYNNVFNKWLPKEDVK